LFHEVLNKQNATIFMEREQLTITKIKEQGLLPLFYHDDATVCTDILKTLYGCGVKCVEFTNRGNQALVNFKVLIKERDAFMPGLLLGIGTIKTGDDATKFINAGADFLVSPVFDSSVCDVAYMNKVLWIPGCMTPTEIHVAEQAGCRLIKLFPGNVLGPGYVEAILPLFKGLDFVVTGGVDPTEESMGAWFKNGVVAVGMGSKLISKTILQNKAFDDLKKNTAAVMNIIATLKK
jgi:2-dehydro-3-deoxyphosphogluconate aldolase / (4S)-4-hydroxy-2-oxoglutarate aldolase